MEERNNAQERPSDIEVDHSAQIEQSLERLTGFISVFKKKVEALDKTIRSLEEKVAQYATELSKAYKETSMGENN